MWIEIYRWYDTRMLGTHNLLLERRIVPRFERLESLAEERLPFLEELRMPTSAQPIFWTTHCSLTEFGKLRKSFLRLNEVTMTVKKNGNQVKFFRVLPTLLGSPSMGSLLPDSLVEFAEVFGANQKQSFSVESLSFGGPGVSAYLPTCDVELLRAAQ